MLEALIAQKDVAPYGGRLMEIDLPGACPATWHEGILAGAPDTEPRSREWRISRFFPRTSRLPAEARLLLMWAGGETMSSADAARWGQSCGLRMTHPLEVLALSAAFPYLYWGFGLSGVGLVPTRFGDYYHKPHACTVWQSMKRGTREAKLCPADAGQYDRTLFVFGRS